MANLSADEYFLDIGYVTLLDRRKERRIIDCQLGHL